MLTPQYTSTIEARSNLGAQPRDETTIRLVFLTWLLSLSCGKLVQPPAIHCVDPLHSTGAFGLVFDHGPMHDHNFHYDLELKYCQSCQVILERGPAIARRRTIDERSNNPTRLCDKAEEWLRGTQDFCLPVISHVQRKGQQLANPMSILRGTSLPTASARSCRWAACMASVLVLCCVVVRIAGKLLINIPIVPYFLYWLNNDC